MSTLAHILLLFVGELTSQDAATKTKASCDSVPLSVGQEVVEFKNEKRARGLSGVISSPSGPVIPGVAVEIVDSKDKCLKATITDADGRFDLKIRKIGRYKLRLSKPGFNTAFAVVRIMPRANGQLELELAMSN
jgi:hypothetical protein